MSVISSCPEPRKLECFLLGRLSGPEVEELASHFADCPHCSDTVKNLHTEDTIVQSLKSPGDTPLPPEKELVDSLIGKVRELWPADNVNCDPPENVAVDIRQADGASAAEFPFLFAAAQPDEIGRLAQYRVLRLLGKGGMGMVFEAEDTQLRRRVALKVMRPSIAENFSARLRFQREAEAMAAVHDDNVATIYHVGQENNVPFLAMEYLEGKPLSALLGDAGNLEPEQAIRLGMQIAEGLAAGHERGLIHRDIKPGNIWIEPQRGGRVKILDFGLVQAAGDDVQLTKSGAIVGTPAYMSPEQAEGRKVDQRCDLFSLGCILYRMTTGQLPYQGANTTAMLLAVTTTEPQSVTAVNPNLPDALAELITQLLAKNPDERPSSAREVAEKLRTIGARLPSGGRSAAASDETDHCAPRVHGQPRSARRRRRPVLVAAGFLFAFIACLAAWQIVQITFRTPSGTLIVEINDKKVEARLKNGKIQILDMNGKLIYTLSPSERNKKLPLGKYELKVVGADGLTVYTEEFVIREGKRVIARVRRQPSRDTDRGAAENVLPIDRAAAEWVTQNGGEVYGVYLRPKLRPVSFHTTKPDQLPKQPIRLRRIDLYRGLLGLGKHTDVPVYIGQVMGQLTELQSLRIAWRIRVDDEFVKGMGRSKSLVELDLFQQRRLTDDCVDHIQKINTLRQLRLTGCRQLSDKAIAKLANMSHLDELSLIGIPLSDALVAQLCNGLPVLKSLTLGDRNGNNRLTSKALISIGRSKQLTYLDLEANRRMTEADLHHLSGLVDLKNLTLRQFREGTLAGLKHLEEGSLNRLTLQDCRFNEEHVDSLARFPRLESIALSRCPVTDTTLKSIGQLQSLKQINVNGAKITNAGIKHIARLPKLSNLSLSDCPIDDKGLIHLQGVKSLSVLYLRQTKVTAAGVSALQKALPNCKFNWDGNTDSAKSARNRQPVNMPPAVKQSLAQLPESLLLKWMALP